MSELQIDDAVEEPLNETELAEETTEESAESAPASEGQHDENDQDAVQKRINKLTWEKHEAKREADKLRAEMESLKTKAPEAVAQVAKDGEAVIPDPDLAIDDPEAYKQQMIAWQKSVVEEAKKQASSVYEQQQQAQQQTQQQEQQRKIQEAYADRVMKSGLDVEKVIEAERVIAGYNPSPDLAQFLISDDNGVQFVNYLANNQGELAELVNMSPMQAAIKLDRLRQKVLEKKSTSAPDPIDEPTGESSKGGGGLSGMTFE